MKRFLLIIIMVLTITPVFSQWEWNPEDSTMNFTCEACPFQYRELVIGLDKFEFGDAYVVDLFFKDYSSEVVYAIYDVFTGDSDPINYQTLLYYVIAQYGWVDICVHTPDLTFTFVIPTVSAYEANKYR